MKTRFHTRFHALALLSALSLSIFSVASRATPIEASYTVNLNSDDPGLSVSYNDIAPNPFSFDLNPGESLSGKLFRIWTSESNVNSDDESPKPISVGFDFVLPSVFNGSMTGETVGGTYTYSSCWFFVCQDITKPYGQVSWNGPLDLYFGPNNDGHIQITLADEYFYLSPVAPLGSWLLGADISGTITLIADATSAVPEPGTLAMFGFGLLALGAALRRRSKALTTL